MSKNSNRKQRADEAQRTAWMEGHVPRRGTEPHETEYRKHLLYENRGKTMLAIEQAVHRGEKNPAVFVIDCQDEVGYAIAAGWLGEERIASHVANISGSGLVPIVALAIPHAIAVGMLETVESSTPEFSELPPDGWVWVVAVAADGLLFSQVKSPRAGA